MHWLSLRCIPIHSVTCSSLQVLLNFFCFSRHWFLLAASGCQLHRECFFPLVFPMHWCWYICCTAFLLPCCKRKINCYQLHKNGFILRSEMSVISSQPNEALITKNCKHCWIILLPSLSGMSDNRSVRRVSRKVLKLSQILEQSYQCQVPADFKDPILVKLVCQDFRVSNSLCGLEKHTKHYFVFSFVCFCSECPRQMCP